MLLCFLFPMVNETTKDLCEEIFPLIRVLLNLFTDSKAVFVVRLNRTLLHIV